VIRDELNLHLKPYQLFFGPETSTSNRCMIWNGGEQCLWCSFRNLWVNERAFVRNKGFLADGNEVVFGALTNEEFEAKCNGVNVVSELEQNIYLQAKTILSNQTNRDLFDENYPKKSIPTP
jgi:hypothetical protein